MHTVHKTLQSKKLIWNFHNSMWPFDVCFRDLQECFWSSLSVLLLSDFLKLFSRRHKLILQVWEVSGNFFCFFVFTWFVEYIQYNHSKEPAHGKKGICVLRQKLWIPTPKRLRLGTCKVLYYPWQRECTPGSHRTLQAISEEKRSTNHEDYSRIPLITIIASLHSGNEWHDCVFKHSNTRNFPFSGWLEMCLCDISHVRQTWQHGRRSESA